MNSTIYRKKAKVTQFILPKAISLLSLCLFSRISAELLYNSYTCIFFENSAEIHFRKKKLSGNLLNSWQRFVIFIDIAEDIRCMFHRYHTLSEILRPYSLSVCIKKYKFQSVRRKVKIFFSGVYIITGISTEICFFSIPDIYWYNTETLRIFNT